MPKFCLSMCLFIYAWIYLSVCLSFCVSIYVCMYLFIHRSICLSVYACICVSVCPYMYLSLCLSICPCICMSMYVSICLWITYASICAYLNFRTDTKLSPFSNVLYLILSGLSFLLFLDSLWKSALCYLLGAWNWDIQGSIENHSLKDSWCDSEIWTLGEGIDLTTQELLLSISQLL